MKSRIKKAVKEITVEKPTRGNFWRMKVAPKETIFIGDTVVHCIVVCKNCGPGVIRIIYKSGGDNVAVDIPSGHVRLFWVYDNLEVEGDPMFPSVLDMQFMPIRK